MRLLTHIGALAALILSACLSAIATADEPAFDSDHRFVVVTFSNDPYRPAARAGTTGRRYTGATYGVAQSAHGNARRIASAYSLQEVTSWPIQELRVHCVVYQIPDSRTTTEVLTALSKDSRVALAQPLQEFRTLTNTPPAPVATSAPTASAPAPYNDPLYGLQTNLTSMGIPAAHEKSQGAGVRIALIDTNVDSSHPDLLDRISGTRSYIGANSPTPAVPGSYRHGTAMAGLIAAVANNRVGIVGIAPLARIEVFAACWQLEPDRDAAACNTFTVAKALAAALEAHIPLINLSLAGPADPLLTALVQSGLQRGVIFVGSATDEPNSFPTNINGVIGVTGSDAARAGSASARDGLLAAPATHVMTLRPGGEYDFESGTSVAAAEITGVLALLLAADSRLTTHSIVSLLKDDAGRLDVNGALVKVKAERGGGRLAQSTR